jgi:hypothetical protein
MIGMGKTKPVSDGQNVTQYILPKYIHWFSINYNLMHGYGTHKNYKIIYAFKYDPVFPMSYQ